jgi:hypothetical protein
MLDVPDNTLEKLRLFTEGSNILITIDAPLYGSVMVFNGRVLQRGGSYVEAEKIGAAIGFPSYENILSEATRFWILDENGVRRVKCREEMAILLEQIPARGSRASSVKSTTVQSAANG